MISRKKILKRSFELLEVKSPNVKLPTHFLSAPITILGFFFYIKLLDQVIQDLPIVTDESS